MRWEELPGRNVVVVDLSRGGGENNEVGGIL